MLQTVHPEEMRLTDANVNAVSPEIYAELTEILRDVFDNDAVVATPELTAPQVEGWDSLGNVRLFLTVEGAFGVRFSAGEISSIKNVGELAGAIAQKRAR
jgi:acyl carrier protein